MAADPRDAHSASEDDDDTDDERDLDQIDSGDEGAGIAEEAPLQECFFELEEGGLMGGKLKTRLFRLYSDRMTVHRAAAARAEATHWLRHVESATLHRLDAEDEELPFRLHVCTPWHTLKLHSNGEHAKLFLDALVGATQHAAGCARGGRGRFGQPLGLSKAVLCYSRYTSAESAAGGRKADHVVGGLASGQGAKEALSGAELTHSGTLLKKGRGRRGYGRPWRSRLVELRSDGLLAYYSSQAERPADGALPDASKAIDIGGASIRALKPADAAGRSHAFVVYHREGTVRLVLAAATAATAALWMSKLEQAAEHHLGRHAAVPSAKTRVAALDDRRTARREAMEAAQRRARLAAQAVGRVALEVSFDVELLRSRLQNWDFAYEGERIEELRSRIGLKLKHMHGSLLGTLSYAIQLQKTATVVYQRSLLAGWARSGFVLKPDFKRSEIGQV